MMVLEQLVNSVPPTPTRVALIAGEENAEYFTLAQKVHDLLAGRGMTCQVIPSSNPQHAYPPEFARLLKQAVDWIMR